MKKLFKPFILLMTAAAAALSLLLPAPEASEAPAAEPARHASADIYTLRAHDGSVCVFDASNTSEPVIVTDIGLYDMRAVDRSMFEKGVTVSSWEEVVRLLEDFSS